MSTTERSTVSAEVVADTEELDDEPGTEVAVRDDGEVAEVYEAELVPRDEPPPVTLIGTIVHDGPAAAWGMLQERPVVRGTVTVGRPTVRVVVTTAQGFGSWTRRAWREYNHGFVRDQRDQAARNRDDERAAYWHEQLEKAKEARAKRALLNFMRVLGWVKVAALILVLVGILLLVGGIAVWIAGEPPVCDPAGTCTGGEGITWTSWWDGIGAVLDTAGAVLLWLGWAAMWLAPLVLATGAFREGGRECTPPRLLLTKDERAQVGAEITSDVIVQAFAHAKVPELTKALDRGESMIFLVTPREQGGGTYFRVQLPIGVAAAAFLPGPKIELVAGNMSRHKHEYWPQKDPETDARTLDCWVADKGALDRPAPPWPLLESGTFDVFRDRLPWGVTMRSDPVEVGMLQKHWLIGATSKQGKTTALRLLLLGLALDPTVELRIADLKGDGDFTMFRERAHTLIEGQADEDAEATCTMLEEAVAEMQRRYDRKRELGIVGSITREMSRRKGSGFHPIYVVCDECQVLYAAPHPVGGKKDDARAWRAAKRLHDQARAVNIHLMQATQRPDDRTLPVMVREGAHVRAALNVPNEEAAKMILADAADRGARPQDLRPGADAGTVVATGEIEDIPKGQAFAIVRTHYVTTQEAYRVITRAMDILKKAGRTAGSALLEVCAEPEPIDHLADIHEAMRDEVRTRTQVVLQRLAERDPDTYEAWDFADLKAELERHGVAAAKVRGVMHVRLDDVEQAISGRAEMAPPA